MHKCQQVQFSFYELFVYDCLPVTLFATTKNNIFELINENKSFSSCLEEFTIQCFGYQITTFLYQISVQIDVKSFILISITVSMTKRVHEKLSSFNSYFHIDIQIKLPQGNQLKMMFTFCGLTATHCYGRCCQPSNWCSVGHLFL